METKQIQRIEEYYHPVWDDDRKRLLFCVGEEKKYFPFFQKVIFFTFGKEIKGNTREEKEENARKDPEVIVSSGEEIYKIWGKIERDKRMEVWIDAVKKNIGLVSYGGGLDSTSNNIFPPEYTKETEIGIWGNLTGSGNVDVGKTERNTWIAEYSYRVGIDDFAVEWMEFSSEPTRKKIEDAKKVVEIEDKYLARLSSGKTMTIDCLECGRKNVHFLDLTSGVGDGKLTMEDRMDNFQEGYCGC